MNLINRLLFRRTSLTLLKHKFDQKVLCRVFGHRETTVEVPDDHSINGIPPHPKLGRIWDRNEEIVYCERCYKAGEEEVGDYQEELLN